MNREIKFRVYDKQVWGMKYINGFNEYGDGWRKGGNPEQKYYQIHFGEHGCMSVAAKDISLMQFTGMYDKNGKEIYEGDVVETENNCYGIIKFLFGGFVCEAIPNKTFPTKRTDSLEYAVDAGITVIGNIYENPELLK